MTNFTSGLSFYRCDSTGDSLTWKKFVPLGSSWQFQADLKFRTLYGNSGTTGVGSLALSADGSNPSIRFLANVTHESSGSVLIEAHYFDGSWHEVLNSGWRSGTAPEYHLQLERAEGSDTFQFTVQSTNGFSYTALTTPIPPGLFAGLSIPGFRVNGAVVDCANVQLVSATSPSPQKYYGLMATNAINDLINHFWTGDAQTGRIVNTWNGYTNAPLPDPRGGLWERGMLYLTLENFYRLRTNGMIQQRLQADWSRTKNAYTTNELEGCGQDSGTNWAVDDAGWSALMYLAAFNATGDSSALDRAKGLVNCAFNRWQDDLLGGGMWYRDAKDIKSLYQAAIVMSSLRTYELTGDQSFFDRAFSCYSWMENYLLRADGLYWVDYDSSGPIGEDRPDDIHEAGSMVSLGGAMAMGVLHARLYRMTTNEVYRARAIRTANGISDRLLTLGGIYLNDRDAWTQGTFAGDWVREVLSLPGISAKHWTTLRISADSIATYARTTNGFYGGSWSGPSEGTNSAWWAIGSKPEQITTSSSSANVIVAAAFFDEQLPALLRSGLVTAMRTASGKLQVVVSGEPGWAHEIQSTTDLSTWNHVTNFFVDPGSRSFNYTPVGSQPKEFFRVVLSVPQ